jgi:hypothetical protein
MRWDAGVHQPPSPFYVQFFGDAYNRLLAVASRLDGLLGGELRVTSWHRTDAENRAAGGQPTSQHLLGTAMDVSGRHIGVSQALLAQVAEKMGAPFGVEALTSEGASVHLQALRYGTSANILGLIPWLRWTEATPAVRVSTRVPVPIRTASTTLYNRTRDT